MAQKINSSQMNPSKTVDANGWTVYDYGAWKEYEKRWTGINPGEIAGGDSANLLTGEAMPSGVAPNTVNVQVSGGFEAGGSAFLYALSSFNATSSSTSATFGVAIRNVLSIPITPINCFVVVRMKQR